MTFIAPPRFSGDASQTFASFRKAPKAQDRRRFADEDSARKALGADGLMPTVVLPGMSLEHLARIALG